MIPDTPWRPTAADIKWQEQWIARLKDSAVWAVPSTQSVFEIDKNAKTFRLTIGEPTDETNRRIAKVFKRLGFSEFGAEPENPLDRFDSSVN